MRLLPASSRKRLPEFQEGWFRKVPVSEPSRKSAWYSDFGRSALRWLALLWLVWLPVLMLGLFASRFTACAPGGRQENAGDSTSSPSARVAAEFYLLQAGDAPPLALNEEEAKSEGIPVERLQTAAQKSLLSATIRNPAHRGAHRFHMEVFYGGRPQILDPVCMPFQIYTGHGLSNRLLIVSLVTEGDPQAAESGTEGSIEGCSERVRFEYLSYIPAFGLGNLEEDLDTLMKSFVRHCIEKLPRRKEAPVSDPDRMNPVHP